MAGHVAIGHAVYLVDVAHVTVVICHNCWLFSIPVFISKIAFSGWIMYDHQDGHISLVLPHHSCQVTLGLCVLVCGCFLYSLAVPQQ